MILETDEEAILYIESHQKPSKTFEVAREQHKELKALIEGDDFKDVLINRIEKIEGEDRARSRANYSRPIIDFFERLFLPISNVYNSTGGSKKYDIKSEALKVKFFNLITNVRGGKTIQKYIEDTGIDLLHTDPNGVIFMEYNSDKWIKPTYKSINSIRAYETRGQQLEVILFEPINIDKGELYRIVDDKTDRLFLKAGGIYTLVEEKTFDHPFNEVPGIVLSNIEKINTDLRLSPVNKIVPLSKEYARDQSIKTVYKFLQGFPIHWRFITQCKPCMGTGKEGDKKCKTCDGHGFYKSKDVSDIVSLPIPDKEQPNIAPNIAGYINPSLETWTKYDDELDLLEKLANKTTWGSFMVEGDNQTATGRWIDVQPVINRLNQYADWSEFVEFKISEWYYRYLVPNSEGHISQIFYGRRYIIDSQDVVLEKYQLAKEKGSNSSILDKLLNEYITAKFKNDPIWLSDELLKASVEPHVHLSIEEVKDIFGEEEAQKKSLFTQWWNDLEMKEKDKEAKVLREDFIKWSKDKIIVKPIEKPNIT